jgi:NADP-dependent 3-hydroxy acid dehydrogenase YdfG
MIRKSGYRFSEKIMLKKKIAAGKADPDRSKPQETSLTLAVVFRRAFMHHSGTARVKVADHKETETVGMTKGGKRVAWVTGGGSGIGEAGAEALAADGWTVVVSGRRKDALDGVVAKITERGGKAEAIALDVSNKGAVNKAAEQILASHGRIDLLVNSAGINVPKRSWADMELEGWEKLVEINLNGVLYCMHAVLPAMRKQKDGCIINVASWAGRHVSKMPGPAYTTTKHAVLALTHSFNMDECVNGLRACCLSPGEVATPILKLRPVVPSAEEQAKMLQPEDCGRTIAFVASMPPRVCMNEILISPTWNRGFIQTPHSRD